MNIPIPLPEGARLQAAEERVPNHRTLCDLIPGSCGVVRRVEGRRDVRRRLMEMGFVSGTTLRVVRVAPFGDPIEVSLHGYHLSLRRSEACTILVDDC